MANLANNYDRVILLCSKSSLSRNGVLNEIERVLAREAKEGGSSVLIPIAIDDHVFEDWSPAKADIATQIREIIIETVDKDIDAAKTRKVLNKLLKALSKNH